MSKTQDKATQQFESLFIAPARAYGSLTLEYYEKLLSAQMEAFRSYSDLSLAQARAWIDVKDSDSLKQVLETQQKAAKELGEVVDLSQEFLQKGQQLAEQNVKAASAATK